MINMIVKFKEGGETPVNSDSISSLLAALTLVEDVPGALAAQKDLKKWKQEQIQTVATNDLVCIMHKEPGELDLGQLHLALQHCPQPWPDEAQNQLPAFLVTMVTALVSKAWLTNAS